MTLKEKLEQHALWLSDSRKGARFVLTNMDELAGADLRYADLRSADLRYANLRSADLRYANLRYANLRSADLSSANLNYADLNYADLNYANLRSADGSNYRAIQIVNTKYFITILDTKVLWGCRTFTFDEIKALKYEDLTTEWDLNEFKLNKKIITECIRYYRQQQKGENK